MNRIFSTALLLALSSLSVTAEKARALSSVSETTADTILSAASPPLRGGREGLSIDSMAAHYLALAVDEDRVRSRRTDCGPDAECSLPVESVALTPPLHLPLGEAGRGFQEAGRGLRGEPSPKRPWLAAAQAFGINVFVLSFDRFVLDADFAKINARTVRHNIKNGFVWDNDQFSTNLFAHPYHGGLYFNAARSNGMNFWESVPYAFGGSLMWETVCEVEPPAINDLIATTVGGVCIGEVTHRISDLVYDDRQRGLGRFARELLGAVVCPMRALNRIITGDAWRVRTTGYKYHDYERLPVNLSIGAGLRYLADDNAMFRGESNPYVNVNLVYGDPFDEESVKPYDYFTADITFGLSSNQPLISGVHLLGRLWSAPVYTGNEMQAEFGIFQHFNYYDSQPVKDGTSMVPFRISEAAAVGPGLIYRFPKTGSLTTLEQRVFIDAILLGGSLSDYYNVIDRDYNMGSGYSLKMNTAMEFGSTGRFTIMADYYRIYTWKGYEGKDLETTDPLYLNAQGDKGNAQLLVVSPSMRLTLGEHLALDTSVSYYWRRTHYACHEDVSARTFTAQMGVAYVF